MEIVDASVLADSESNYDPEYAAVEAWLDEHQAFVNHYFIR